MRYAFRGRSLWPVLPLSATRPYWAAQNRLAMTVSVARAFVFPRKAEGEGGEGDVNSSVALFLEASAGLPSAHAHMAPHPSDLVPGQVNGHVTSPSCCCISSQSELLDGADQRLPRLFFSLLLTGGWADRYCAGAMVEGWPSITMAASTHRSCIAVRFGPLVHW